MMFKVLRVTIVNETSVRVNHIEIVAKTTRHVFNLANSTIVHAQADSRVHIASWISMTARRINAKTEANVKI